MKKKNDWIGRGIDYIVRHAVRRETAPTYDRRKRELHDRAIRRLTDHIRKNSARVRKHQWKQLDFFG